MSRSDPRSPPPAAEWAIRGRALHATAPDRLQAFDDAVITLAPDGRIEAVLPVGTPAGEAAVRRHAGEGSLRRLAPHQLLLPGMVDLHIHAPQWPQRGAALDLPLERWLHDYTFPLESRFADLDFAQDVYRSMVTALLAHGTTTAMYFATLHLPATRALADICLHAGQRALIGRTAMDDPDLCPDYYRDRTPEAAAGETADFIDHVRALPGNDRSRIQTAEKYSEQSAAIPGPAQAGLRDRLEPSKVHLIKAGRRGVFHPMFKRWA